ncbi:MAG: RpiB/LacA/LacB family sugar-phosphate isomerase [Acidimicrobiales bacterium]
MRVAIGADHTGLVLRPTVADAVRAANRLPGVRAAYAADHYTGHQMVEHDHVNVLTLGARVMGPEVAAEIVTAFVTATPSVEERHVLRLGEVL